MVLIGKLNTSPKQAHFIFLLFKTLWSTLIILIAITAKVTVFVSMGLNPVKKASLNANSVKAYT